MQDVNLNQICSAGIDLDLKGGAIVVSVGRKPKDDIFIRGLGPRYPITIRVNDLAKKIIHYFRSIRRKGLIPKIVSMEGEAFGKAKANQSQGNNKKSRLMGVVLDRLFEEGYVLNEYAPTSVKMFAGHGFIKYPEMIEFVADHYGIRYFKQNGDPSDDLTVAFLLSQFGLNHFGKISYNKFLPGLIPKQKQAVRNACEKSIFYCKDRASL